MKEIFNTTFIENTSRALLAISNGDDPSNYNKKHIEILNNIGLLDNNGNLIDKLTRNNVFAVGKEIVKLSIKSKTYSDHFNQFKLFYSQGKERIKKYIDFDLFSLLEFYEFFNNDISEIIWQVTNLPNSLDGRKNLAKGRVGEFLSKKYYELLNSSNIIEWTSQDINTMSPYDLKLTDSRQQEFFIEVKASTSNTFFLQRSEWLCYQANIDKYIINLWDISNLEDPKLYINNNFKEFNSLNLIPNDNKNSKWKNCEISFKDIDNKLYLNNTLSSFTVIKLTKEFKNLFSHLISDKDLIKIL